MSKHLKYLITLIYLAIKTLAYNDKESYDEN